MIILIFSAAAIAAVAALLIRSSWERGQLAAERYTITNRSIKRNLRIAFLCDIHDRLTPKGISTIYEVLKEEGPDIMLFGGDIFTLKKNAAKGPDTKAALELVRRVSGLGPVIYAEGNHELRLRKKFPEEFGSFIKELEQCGGLYLMDDHVLYRGTAIYAAALDEEYFKKCIPGITGSREMPVDYLIKKLGLPENGCFNILLMHSPLYLKAASEWGADLVLSGHFHGGTIRLPYLGGLMTPQLQFFMKECSGLHQNGSTQMIVSRGIGTHSIKLRINDMPEISVIELAAADK